MRPLIVLVLLGALGASLGATLVVRTRAAATPRALPPPRVVAAPGGASSLPGNGPAAPGDAGDAGGASPTLRVLCLGWELGAPGVLANHGVGPGAGSEFSAAGIVTEVHVASAMPEVEAALALGGADPRGADIAVVPLPVLVASYERLRVLQPDVFFVTGWAGGREALIAADAAALGRPLEGRDVMITGRPGTASAFLAAEVLQLAGAAPARLRWLPPGDTPPYTEFAAVERDPSTRDPGGRPVLVTTSDATHLVPYVAVASHAFASRHGDELRRWASVWLSGTRRLHDDPAAAAREIGRLPQAPDALELVSRLGMVTPSGLADNARAMGLAGRGAVTLTSLFRRAWRDWRAAGLLTTPEPDLVPLATDTVAALVRASPTRPGDEAAPTPRAAVPGRPAIVTWRLTGPRLDEAALTEASGWTAGAFERATLRVRARDEAALVRVVEAIRARFGLSEVRVVPLRGPGLARNAAAAVEVHVGL